ncbi:esterase family protein [Clostridium swellfunianum]|uniref:alpha/beta hydrolase n=1 Tax=Clostridium swellfunianum TaxID=1367462 RepID=UPI002030B1A4|nr:alpha/beta hydrolase family protein [Clostridium swellfunianum]MCM0649565.1 esterase family protein [Clostridium swellfunianum]
MALIHCDFFSEVLGISTSICVILPQETRSQIGMRGSEKKEKYPTLYLLHGLSDDHTIWQRRTSIERYVSDIGLAVVMPNAGRSFYTDMKHGYKYFTFISEELPEITKQFFPLSDKREDTFAAGLSMGGYGAFKLALSCPDKYAAAASLSGVVDIASRVKRAQLQDTAELESIFGNLNAVENSENDLFYLSKKVLASDVPKPKLYQCCGTEDFLYEDNINFKGYIEKTNFDYTYEEGPGIHNWNYWDTQIQKVLKWLPIK